MLLIPLSTEAHAAPGTLGMVLPQPTTISASSETKIVIHYAFDDNDFIPGSVVINNLDGQNRIVSRAMAMRDDGVYPDIVANDKVFVAVIPVKPTANQKQIRLQISAAYKGVIKRITSEPIIVNVLEGGYEGDRPLIIGDSVIFSSGETKKLINETGAPDSEGTTIRVTERAVASSDGSHILIRSEQSKIYLQKDVDSDAEPELISSHIRYLSSAGVVWEISAAPSYEVFFLPENSNVVSSDGSKVLVIKERIGDSHVSVVSELGQTLYESNVSMSELIDAKISSSGRCLMIYGYSNVEFIGSPSYQVHDIETNYVSAFSGDSSNMFFLTAVEDSNGCFSLQ